MILQYYREKDQAMWKFSRSLSEVLRQAMTWIFKGKAQGQWNGK